jgi:holo-[acyl-carrier protein] synthase
VIVGLGVDLVEVRRLSRLLEGPLADRFLARVFTDGERRYCDAHGPARAVHYAGRFAAKEALVKALGGPEGLRWHDMELRSEGAPRFHTVGRAAEGLDELGVAQVHVTLSHDGGMALAFVVLEGK